MIGGLTLFAVFTGVVSAVMVQKLKGGMELKEMELDELRNHTIICGWNRSTSLIMEEFQSDKNFRYVPIVLIAEFTEEPPLDYNCIDRSLIYVIKGDYTNIDVLRKAGVDKASYAFILPDKTVSRSDQDRDARTVLAALILEKLNKNIFTCVELLNRDNETHLEIAGVEEVIVSDEYAGNIMAAAAKNHGIIHVINELFTSKYGNEFSKVPVSPSWVGKPVMELYTWLKKKYNAILISVESDDDSSSDTIAVNPDNNYIFRDGDRIIVISDRTVVLE